MSDMVFWIVIEVLLGICLVVFTTDFSTVQRQQCLLPQEAH